jgi:putative toxin-antitoxin system antitoxin component (TIGR02293 family)
MSNSSATFHYQPASEELNLWVAALGLNAPSQLDLIDQVEQGLPAAAFDRFSEVTGLSREALARTVRISTRTVARRREKDARLDPATSERLVRLARLYAKAQGTIGEADLARQWMQTPRTAFAGKTPLQMAETELGAREVEDLLLRTEHGVFT